MTTRAKKREETELKGGESGLGRWLLTYADLITLLMLFFVVLYAMSVVDQKKYETLSESLIAAFHTGSVPISLQQPGALHDAQAGRERYVEGTRKPPAPVAGRPRLEIYGQAVSFFQPEIRAHRIRVVEDERGLVIQLGADTFFAPGTATFSRDALFVLEKVSEFLRPLPNMLRVEGHTDNTPVAPGGAFPTNWELSSQRAINVLRAFADYGVDEEHLSATAYADTRPMVSNDTPEGRAYNRRVDVTLMRTEQ